MLFRSRGVVACAGFEYNGDAFSRDDVKMHFIAAEVDEGVDVRLGWAG